MSRPTIKQIAEMSGVSIATVSRFINGTANISPSTGRKIAEAIQRLNYPLPETAALPVQAADARSRLILVDIASMSNPCNIPIVQGIRDAAALHGYHTLVNVQPINVLTESSLLELISRVPLAGAIFCCMLDAPLFSRLYRTLPFVQCCEISEGQTQVSTVSINDTAAIRRIMDYLFSIKRDKIALLGVSDRYMYGRHRRQGYLEALQAHGVEPNPNWILTVPDSDYDSAYSIAMEMLSHKDIPNAIVAVSDVLAMAAIHACQERGLKVPGDIAITGFDNTIHSRSTVPQITTISQPSYSIGYAGCELLLERINDPSSVSQQLQLETELIIRGSTMLY